MFILPGRVAMLLTLSLWPLRPQWYHLETLCGLLVHVLLNTFSRWRCCSCVRERSIGFFYIFYFLYLFIYFLNIPHNFCFFQISNWNFAFFKNASNISHILIYQQVVWKEVASEAGYLSTLERTAVLWCAHVMLWWTN